MKLDLFLISLSAGLFAFAASLAWLAGQPAGVVNVLFLVAGCFAGGGAAQAVRMRK